MTRFSTFRVEYLFNVGDEALSFIYQNVPHSNADRLMTFLEFLEICQIFGTRPKNRLFFPLVLERNQIHHSIPWIKANKKSPRKKVHTTHPWGDMSDLKKSNFQKIDKNGRKQQKSGFLEASSHGSLFSHINYVFWSIWTRGIQWCPSFCPWATQSGRKWPPKWPRKKINFSENAKKYKIKAVSNFLTVGFDFYATFWPIKHVFIKNFKNPKNP